MTELLASNFQKKIQEKFSKYHRRTLSQITIKFKTELAIDHSGEKSFILDIWECTC